MKHNQIIKNKKILPSTIFWMPMHFYVMHVNVGTLLFWHLKVCNLLRESVLYIFFYNNQNLYIFTIEHYKQQTKPDSCTLK